MAPVQVAKRPVAISKRFCEPGQGCELCDKPANVLLRMQRFDKKGTLLACAACVQELCGKSEMVE